MKELELFSLEVERRNENSIQVSERTQREGNNVHPRLPFSTGGLGTAPVLDGKSTYR